MAADGLSRKRLLIVGLPRSGTTLMATLLGAQPNVHFLTDYFPAFTGALERLGKRWDEPLALSERRIALALVRDQFLRVRHPVLVKQTEFETLDELHRRVLGELAGERDELVGHKLLLSPAHLGMTLEHGGSFCLLLYRDPRDAALSFFHRTGHGVENYLRTWSETLAFVGHSRRHPRLLALKFESLIAAPEAALAEVGAWLGVSLSADVPELSFRRSRAHGATPWRENSAFEDVGRRFDQSPIGRWKSELSSPIVRYANWATAPALAQLGYELSPALLPSRAERLRFSGLRALELAEHYTYAGFSRGVERLRHELWRTTARGNAKQPND